MCQSIHSPPPGKRDRRQLKRAIVREFSTTVLDGSRPSFHHERLAHRFAGVRIKGTGQSRAIASLFGPLAGTDDPDSATSTDSGSAENQREGNARCIMSVTFDIRLRHRSPGKVESDTNGTARGISRNVPRCPVCARSWLTRCSRCRPVPRRQELDEGQTTIQEGARPGRAGWPETGCLPWVGLARSSDSTSFGFMLVLLEELGGCPRDAQAMVAAPITRLALTPPKPKALQRR